MSSREPDLPIDDYEKWCFRNIKIWCVIVFLLVISVNTGHVLNYIDDSWVNYTSQKERRSKAEATFEKLISTNIKQEMLDGMFQHPVSIYPDLREKLLLKVLGSDRWLSEIIEPAIIDRNFSAAEMALIVYDSKKKDGGLMYAREILYAMTKNPNSSASHFAYHFSDKTIEPFKYVIQGLIDECLDSGDFSGLNMLNNWKILFPDLYISLGIEEKLNNAILMANKFQLEMKESKKINEKVAELEREVGRQEEYLKDRLVIDAYMIKQYQESADFVYYEIAYPTLRDRAILSTVKTRFQSKGWFSMAVRRMESINIKLSESEGGFVVEWPMFMEDQYYKESHEKLEKAQKELEEALKNESAISSRIEENKLKVKQCFFKE